MSSLLDKVMHEFVQATCSMFGEAVKGIILFGSYARSEANDESDIDVMGLLPCQIHMVHRFQHP